MVDRAVTIDGKSNQTSSSHREGQACTCCCASWFSCCFNARRTDTASVTEMTRLNPSPDNVGHDNKNTDDESEREDEEEQSPITMEHNGGQSSENTDGKNKDKHGKTNVEPEQNRLLKLLDWLIRGTGEEKKDKKEGRKDKNENMSIRFDKDLHRWYHPLDALDVKEIRAKVWQRQLD